MMNNQTLISKVTLYTKVSGRLKKMLKVNGKVERRIVYPATGRQTLSDYLALREALANPREGKMT